ncbi:MAG: YdeI/OmpD-associated family protein [Flavobacteriia bacterium]|jgi:hypothetical protein
MQTPIINDDFQMEKYPGKGGWTYVIIPGFEVKQKKNFGMVKVKGTVDGYSFKAYNLFPTKDGNYFFPIKAEIRKKIFKQEGDWVKVVLEEDMDPLIIPEELTFCLADDPSAHQTFFSFKESEQKLWVDWIFSAKREETKVKRITEAMIKLSKGQRFYDKEI